MILSQPAVRVRSTSHADAECLSPQDVRLIRQQDPILIEANKSFADHRYVLLPFVSQVRLP